MPERVAVTGGEPHGRAGLEVAVVGAAAQSVEEAGRGGARAGCSDRSSRSPSAGACSPDRVLDGGPRLAQRAGLGVDGEGGLVAEQVAGHGGEHEGQLRVRLGHRDARAGRPRSAPGRRWRSRWATPCGPGRSPPPWRRRRRWTPRDPAAHTRISGSDERSMCFLSSVASQAMDLVAELAQLDAQLLGGDAVRAVADDGPVALGRGQLLGGARRSSARRATVASIAVGQLAEGGHAAAGSTVPPHLLGDGPRQQEAGRDLG